MRCPACRIWRWLTAIYQMIVSIGERSPVKAISIINISDGNIAVAIKWGTLPPPKKIEVKIFLTGRPVPVEYIISSSIPTDEEGIWEHILTPRL